MTPELRVLDANLRALLRRAWSPVRPADAFREHLLAEVLERVEARAGSSAPPGAESPAPSALRGPEGPQGTGGAEGSGEDRRAPSPRGAAAPAASERSAAGPDRPEAVPGTPPGTSPGPVPDALSGPRRSGAADRPARAAERRASAALLRRRAAAFVVAGLAAAALLLTLRAVRDGEGGAASGEASPPPGAAARGEEPPPAAGRPAAPSTPGEGAGSPGSARAPLEATPPERTAVPAEPDEGEQGVEDAVAPGTATLVLDVVAPPAPSTGGAAAGPDGAPPAARARIANPRVRLRPVLPLPEVTEPRIVRPRRPEPGEGPLLVEGLEPDRYEIAVRADGFALWVGGPVELVRDRATRVEVRLERGSAVRGVVRDAEGEPVAGAWVVSEGDVADVPLPLARESLHGGELARIAVADAEGRFAFERLRPGDHVLRAAAAGHAPGWSDPVSVPASAERGEAEGTEVPPSEMPAVEIRLQRGGTVRGRVEREDGSPWPEVEVVAALNDVLGERPRMTYGAAIADAHGEYAIEGLPPGSYVVLRMGSPDRPEAAQRPEFRFLDLREGAEVVCDFAADLESAGVRVFGRVETTRGEPVAGMGLSLLREGALSTSSEDHHYGYTDGDGGFEFADIPPGDYLFYITPDRGGTVVEQDAFEVPDWVAVERDVVVPADAVEGRVVDGRTGDPLARSLVFLFSIVEPDDGGSFVARGFTGADGRFALPHVPRGYHRLVAFATAGELAHEYVQDVLPREDGGEIVLELHPGGQIATRVVDPSGEPIAGARLSFVNEVGVPILYSESDRTDAEGRHVARGAKPGAWTVRAEAPGREAAEREVVVTVGATATVELVLPPERR